MSHIGKVHQLFAEQLAKLIDELNEALAHEPWRRNTNPHWTP